MEQNRKPLLQRLNLTTSPTRLFLVVVLVALLAGLGTGYVLSSTATKSSGGVSISSPLTNTTPKSAQQDNQTFKDFAEGTIQNKPSPSPGSTDSYSEGAYLLIRDNAVPVALTSSVVDLSQYVGKKVKVYGETQKAIQEGWLMDVGKVDVE